MNRMNIAVAGTGYVGLSIAALLSRQHNVVAVDVIKSRVDNINAGISPIKDEGIEAILKDTANISLRATINAREAYGNADYVIIAVPTNYNTENGCFDTSHIEEVVDLVTEVNKSAVMIIKSTIPIGYTNRLRLMHPDATILFSPEFLRESKAISDLINPSRIIVGVPMCDAKSCVEAGRIAAILSEAASNNPPVLIMGLEEAESVKLFANTYLAMRVAYFNELDTYAEHMGLNAKDIIKGVSLDPRIGDYYNNPSFGYGGYCFPKDTKQTLANCQCIKQNIFSAIVLSNYTRKENVANSIKLRVKNGVVGVYRLAMKSGSDNFRESAIIDVANMLEDMGLNILIYEPTVSGDIYGMNVCNDLKQFKEKSNIIIANRVDEGLHDVMTKVYSRDCFHDN